MGTESLSLIPALERYIETGDIDFFDAFNEFLFIWNTSEKTAEAEARKEMYEQAMSKLDEAVREYSRYLDKIKKQFKVITKGVEKEVKESAEQRKALYDSLEKLPYYKDYASAMDIKKFLDKYDHEEGDLRRQRLYLFDGKQARVIDALCRVRCADDGRDHIVVCTREGQMIDMERSAAMEERINMDVLSVEEFMKQRGFDVV